MKNNSGENDTNGGVLPPLHATPGSAITDTDRINWLEAHPLPTEVRGGVEDGHTGKAWVVAAHAGTLREAIDVLILSQDT